ncbi:hypothetical protein CROQUDRAFT_650431 [Cronartium quercuum f. sp. fusiforme G11]|uniref:Uncharacterized protein n=1 Tax=Cronartium quercuum f. sp. fusiforme G11 TaxID=708437 RepID=A0A9P6NTB8_9BASI|nr:hypothetical protein CROQUDRAFT_650431 [Cronartium quercuum f. sp. fusiforme G11]
MDSTTTIFSERLFSFADSNRLSVLFMDQLVHLSQFKSDYKDWTSLENHGAVLLKSSPTGEVPLIRYQLQTSQLSRTQRIHCNWLFCLIFWWERVLLDRDTSAIIVFGDRLVRSWKVCGGHLPEGPSAFDWKVGWSSTENDEENIIVPTRVVILAENLDPNAIRSSTIEKKTRSSPSSSIFSIGELSPVEETSNCNLTGRFQWSGSTGSQQVNKAIMQTEVLDGMLYFGQGVAAGLGHEYGFSKKYDLCSTTSNPSWLGKYCKFLPCSYIIAKSKYLRAIVIFFFFFFFFSFILVGCCKSSSCTTLPISSNCES